MDARGASVVAAAAMTLIGTPVEAQTPRDTQAPGRTPIRYTLTFPAPQTHYVEVAASIPTRGRAEVELMMAVWTPGSYLVREYERNVEELTASAGGRQLAVAKSDKNRWRVTTGGAPAIDLKYRVYGREMSVRTNWIESAFALLNGAPTFITLADSPPRPHDVRIELPDTWSESATALPPAADGAARHFVAPDYDTLV